MESERRSESSNHNPIRLLRERIAGRPKLDSAHQHERRLHLLSHVRGDLRRLQQAHHDAGAVLEENYEDENNVGEPGTPFVLRHQEYWSLTAGALAGHMYGSFWIDRFATGWQQHLSSQSVTELGYFKNFFTGINFHNWCLTRITPAYGRLRHIQRQQRSSSGQDDYATAAKSSDGSLAVIYTPVAHTLTVAMGNFSGPVTAKWFDPTNATFQTVAGSPFPNSGSHNFTTPGNNSAGDPDWVLLLQAASGSPTPTPTATATFTPHAYSYSHTDATPTATLRHTDSYGYCNCNSNRTLQPRQHLRTYNSRHRLNAIHRHQQRHRRPAPHLGLPQRQYRPLLLRLHQQIVLSLIS